MTADFTADFLWGASTAPHQIEGNNVSSDWWSREQQMPAEQRSGDACDSLHRYEEDLALLVAAGLTSYRFGIEWARIEPEQGMVSAAYLEHYRRMIARALELGLVPVVTLNHFTVPQWFEAAGGWFGADAIDHFRRYVDRVLPLLTGVGWVVTINEPNMLAMMVTARRIGDDPEARKKFLSPTVEGARRPLPLPDAAVGERLVEAHHAVRDAVRSATGAKVGWSVAARAFRARPGSEDVLEHVRYEWEDRYLEAARGDDIIGVQAYATQWVGPDGIESHPKRPDNTLVGTPVTPEALEIAVRHAWEVTGAPVLVTENGIATADDEVRVRYTRDALRGLRSAMEDGVDVRGYLHWSLLDNYEWGHWEPTFGLVAVDRETFVRTPKPSLGWLGDVARTRGASL
jgi:beta-glucosidase